MALQLPKDKQKNTNAILMISVATKEFQINVKTL